MRTPELPKNFVSTNQNMGWNEMSWFFFWFLAISPNDFISVSARHSYFMVVKDVEDILSRGDALTFRIYFDLQAKRKAYDVEVIG